MSVAMRTPIGGMPLIEVEVRIFSITPDPGGLNGSARMRHLIWQRDANKSLQRFKGLSICR